MDVCPKGICSMPFGRFGENNFGRKFTIHAIINFGFLWKSVFGRISV